MKPFDFITAPRICASSAAMRSAFAGSSKTPAAVGDSPRLNCLAPWFSAVAAMPVAIRPSFNIRLSLPVGSELSIQFDIVLDANLPNGTFVTNQADLVSGGSTITVSDDPYVNGQADPNVPGDEDPTRIIIEGPPTSALIKAETRATSTIGETLTYRVTVPALPHTSPLYDVRILDDLLASAADLEFVGVTKVSAGGTWTPVNTGTPTAWIAFTGELTRWSMISRSTSIIF